jgi:HEAT repeat protein
MKCRSRTGRLLPTATLLAAIAFGVGVSGCRTTTEDVHRWANTAQGPRKLVAVLTHDKYPMDLRVEAAMTLVSMKPRFGRRIGIGNLLDALNELPEGERAKVVAEMVPKLEAEIRKPASGTPEARVDTSIAYKDAAYALLTNDGSPLVTDKTLVDRLKAALSDWAIGDFSARMDDSSQAYGMEQVLRMLGAPGVRGLPALIAVDFSKTDRICDIVSDIGDPATKLEASKKLVAVAQEINSDKWIKANTPKLEAANAASKLKPTKEQFAKQLDQYQEEQLLRSFGSMKKIGQPPIAEYLLNFAGDKSQSEKRRATALIALEGQIDKDNKSQVDRILTLASAEDTPDSVRDAAMRRVGEMPRKLVVDRLYPIFDSKEWKVRWVAAELILKMSDSSQIDEFMSHIGHVKGMSITEPLRYGQLIGELKKVKTDPVESIDKYSETKYPVTVRLSALGYYYQGGSKNDLAKVDRYASDNEKVPECIPGAKECEWKCTVEAGGKSDEKTVQTVGDFVSFCIKPALEKRAPAASPAGGKK